MVEIAHTINCDVRGSTYVYMFSNSDSSNFGWRKSEVWIYFHSIGSTSLMLSFFFFASSITFFGFFLGEWGGVVHVISSTLSVLCLIWRPLHSHERLNSLFRDRPDSSVWPYSGFWKSHYRKTVAFSTTRDC